MDHGANWHMLNQNASSDEVLLASSCPKKRAGRKKFKETRHPVYRGVRQRNGNRWVCEVRAPHDKSRIWLGTYPTAEMAARAHDVAALALKGRTACLNFADSAWRLRVPESTDTREIQRAAAEAAEAFRGEASEVVYDGGNSSIQENDENEVLWNYTNDQVWQGNYNNNNGEYVDEEAVFDMPGLLANMAEGLLLPPPPHNPYGGFNYNESESEYEVSLWNFSA